MDNEQNMNAMPVSEDNAESETVKTTTDGDIIGSDIADTVAERTDESNAETESASPEAVNENTAESELEEEPAEVYVHHHHHHHHHRSKWGRFKHNIKRFFKKNRRILLILLVVSLAGLALILATIAITMSAVTAPNEEQPVDTSASDSSEASVRIKLNQQAILVCQTPIYSYTVSESTAEPRSIQMLYNIQQTRVDTSTKAFVEYGVVNLGRYESIKYTTLYLLDNTTYEANSERIEKGDTSVELYTGAKVYRNYNASMTSFEMSNLKTGTLYRFKVVVTLDSMVDLETEGYFRTATSPRTLNLDGIINARDIGGWMRVSGNLSIKQGMIFRGSEFDGITNSKLLATSEARDQMLTFLNIRSEIDLRGQNVRVAGLYTLGDGVNVLCTSAPVYNEIVYRIGDQYDTEAEKAREAQAKEQIKEIFTFLADSSNYPIYIHDTYGVDKTGTVCILLEAILGVKDTDIYKDYMMSAFSLQSPNRGMYQTMVSELKKLSNSGSLREGAQNYLLSCGVSHEQLISIQNILLERAPETIPFENPAETSAE